MYSISVINFTRTCAYLTTIFTVASVMLLTHVGSAGESVKQIRAGIIGLDTSHCVEFTKILNNPKNVGELAEITIVVAYPGGSPDIPSSWDRVSNYTSIMRSMGVQVTSSIDHLLSQVDVVLLESVDGRRHLAQARPVIAAGKPLFIDKPLAASLTDAMKIFQLAKKNQVPCFSASSLRFGSSVQSVRENTSSFGEVRNCTAWSPLHLEPHHPDLFWYGIHGVETLYTIMGSGCQTVKRVSQNKVVGEWKGRRRGTYIAKDGYGANIEGTKKCGEVGGFEGYTPLLIEIVKFFKTGKPPVSTEETLEILAFMEAADESKRQNGTPVSLEIIMKKANDRLDEISP